MSDDDTAQLDESWMGAAEPNVVATLHFPPAGDEIESPVPPASRLSREMVNVLARMFELEASLANSRGLVAAVYRDDGRWCSHLPATADLLNRYFGPKTCHTSFRFPAGDAPRVAMSVAELFGARITWVRSHRAST